MSDDHYDARSLRGWTPTRFFQRDDGQPTVEWRQLGDLRLTAPFFLQTVATARIRGCPSRETPADTLDALADLTPELALSGLVFHLSRCGSTLVSQMLAALPAHVVVSEAEPVEEILRSDRWPMPVPNAVRIRWLRGLVHAFGSRRFPEERRLFLKLDPWQIFDLNVIRAAFPGVPCVFLYRDPVEILSSQSDNMAGTMVSGTNGPERIGLTPEEVFGMTVEEYCARALGLMAQAAADAAEHDPNFQLMAYPQLPAAVETIIAKHFGLAFDPSDIARLQAVARFHAKAPGKLVFQEDSTRKQREAGEDLRALAARWIDEEYVRLEQIRTARS